ncbi:putative domain of unknown function (DUF427) [Paenarthrobacter aurescens TC1]|uniref:DUF427 domain-containing protein n=2 Tax=Micrococcales TaxID=85006 RepID=A1R2K4_PAEAT|nr:putative domain of unknown function (DUF427) [Paenarthrobacter aurescens TC1]
MTSYSGSFHPGPEPPVWSGKPAIAAHKPHELDGTPGTPQPIRRGPGSDAPAFTGRSQPSVPPWDMVSSRSVSGVFRRPRPIKPKKGQESVWDYPRPPRIEPRSERVVVRLGGQVIVDTTDAVRVLETSHPPVYYLPFDAFPSGVLVPHAGTSFCEFKGEASYFDVVAGGVVVSRGGWTYANPARGFEPLSSRVALYPQHMDSCEINGEQVTFQQGGFYGGWITQQIVGPFKGGPATSGW